MPSIREQIVVSLENALKLISIANGYSNDIAGGVHRYAHALHGQHALPLIEIGVSDERKRLSNLIHWTCELSVQVTVLALHLDPTPSDSTDEYIDTLMVDVEKAIGTVLLVQPTFDQEHRLLWRPLDRERAQRFVGALLVYQSTYNHRIADPASV